MKFTAEQEDRLARFAAIVQGKFPGDSAAAQAHLRSAREFELFLLGRDLSFSQESFRVYLLEMHRAAKGSQEERAAEQQRLRIYYHSFSKELTTAIPASANEQEPSPPPAAPEPPATPTPSPPSPEPPPPTEPAAAHPEGTPFEDLPEEDEMVCPQCGLRQPRSVECAKCGIVFEKWRNRPGGPQAQVAIDALRRELQGRLLHRPAPRERSAMDVILLYLVAPLAAFFLFTLFQSLNASQRGRLIAAQRELLALSKEISAVDEPPRQRIACYARVERPRPPLAPFSLMVPQHLPLSPTEEPSLEVALVPRDPILSRFVAEDLTVSLRRTWTNPNVGTQGIEQGENIWNAKELIKQKWEPKNEKRPPPLGPGEAAWRYALPLAGAAEKPGTYFLSLSVVGWYPRPFQGFRAAYEWSRRSYGCQEAAFEVRSFEEVRELRAVLSTQREGLERDIRTLHRKEHLSRYGKYLFFLLMVSLGALVFYRAFFPKKEEEPPVRAFD